MMIGYVLDTHFGEYDQPMPGPATAYSRLQTLRDEAVLADQLGFGGIFVPDRHARTESAVGSALAFLASLAPDVKRAHLGVYSLVLTTQHPMVVAEEGALVDLLTVGRFTLAVSMGFHPRYWAQFGADPRQRVSRFEESLDILKLAWKGRPFDYDGKRFPLQGAHCVPAPFTPGGPPVWIGGESSAQRQRAAERADGWAAGLAPIVEEGWHRRSDQYRSRCEELGKTPHIALMRDAFVARTYEEAARLAGPAMVAEQIYYLDGHGGKPLHPDFQSAADYTVDRLRPHVVLGSPADCIESISSLRERLGVDSLVLRFRFPLGPSVEAVRDSLQLFGEEVLPYVCG
jgi:alkanesulfonate monooxygenase SsuD/methylene tetrahydromethanopterin reductase-like flavin-dependent oxidoreductase (luciferase family)